MIVSLFASVALGQDCTDTRTLMGYDNVNTAKNICEWGGACVFIHDMKDMQNEKWSCEKADGMCNNMEDMQCGGHSFVGQTCCPAGTTCYKKHHQYSACKTSCPEDDSWSCDSESSEESDSSDDSTMGMHCVGEISSADARCGEMDNQEDCENEGKSIFSDGLCDWVKRDSDTGGDPCECQDEFYWDGKKYDECAVTEADGKSWCYVKGGASCAEATESTKFEGMFYIEDCNHDCDCMEMFLFEGTAYTGCTDAGDTNAWCFVKGFEKCNLANESTEKPGYYKRYCKSEDCPSQKEIDVLPALSARTVCEQAGCEYSTDASNPFKTLRYCKKPKQDDSCKGDMDGYVAELFDPLMSGVDDCMSAVRFLELQALGDPSAGCAIPLANYMDFGILTKAPKYATLNEICCESCADPGTPRVCTLDADTYRTDSGQCAAGEEMFVLGCDEVNCIKNSDCTVDDFGLDEDMFECDSDSDSDDDDCKDRDTYASKLFNFDMSGVNDCLSAVKFLELQALGDASAGCAIPLATYKDWGLLNMDPKYETLNDMCCTSCKKYPDLCTLDADSYVSTTGSCKSGETMFKLYCNEVNCIKNSDCELDDFNLKEEMFECEECLKEDTLWKHAQKKVEADSILKCYQECLSSRKCSAYSWIETSKKPCRHYRKSKRSKAKRGVVSGKKNCHPAKGRVRNKKKD